MSERFERAMREYRECREAYEDARLAAYLLAEDECRGALLNARGRAAGIDALSLFMGNATRAYAYASPELVEHWRAYPRVTFADFEAGWPYPDEEAA